MLRLGSETKVIKTAALKLGALDKTLFAARGLKRIRSAKMKEEERETETCQAI